MILYEVEWSNGKQEVNLPVSGQGSGRNRQEDGAEHKQSVRKCLNSRNKEAGRPGTGK